MRRAIDDAVLLTVKGRVREVVGTIIRASVPSSRIGDMCRLYTPGEDVELFAEVVGFSRGDALLSPIGDVYGVSTNTLVISMGRSHHVPVGLELLGRVLDGFGKPMDGNPTSVRCEAHYPVYASPPAPMTRRPISTPLHTGVRAIDGLLTCGEGQRVGIFAAAGGGKSTLLGMLARNTDADVVVIALIGERGREVREFIERELGTNGMGNAVVVCATSDRPAMERVKASFVATAVAEYFRDQGKRVLLLVDSVTRLARAQREIGLAVGEPPARRGFPPSVFNILPRLMERAGTNEKGSITAFYTVLVEGDDMNEPVADEVRSVLDGHIVLSRKLGIANHYPAIDILASVSRVMNAIVPAEHLDCAGRFRELLSKHQEIELLVRIGEYKEGTDRLADKAIKRIAEMNRFLRQNRDSVAPYPDTLSKLEELVQ